MHVRRVIAAALGVAALTAAALVAPALGQEGGDLDCGDPGTFHNMPIEPGNDPHGLDADGDGIGCEDPAAFGGAAPEPAPEPEPEAEPESTPAAPVRGQPTFTG